MDTESLVIRIITEDFYKDIANDVEKWFDKSNHDDDKKPLPISKNKKVIGFFKDELGGRIMKKVVGLRVKIYAYLIDDDSEHKKRKGTKKCVIKREHTQQAHHVDSTSIQRGYYVDTSKTKFRRISTSFPRTFFNVISMFEKSTSFPRTFFNVVSMVKKSTLFPHTFFDVISFVEISTVFILTFFDVILMVE